jgi:ABC-2 type transport system ATP-binding protein
MEILDFKAVWKTYPKQIGDKAHTALSDVSFRLDQGETLGLVGANGAGKSTTLRLLMGFLKPDRGTIRIYDRSPEDHLLRRKIGYLPEVANFPSNLTILDMLGFTGRTCLMTSAQIARASEEWLRNLGLWEARKRPLRHYSKGMQQRASFALALMHDPELFILDEPMSGLDPFGRAEISDLIRSLKRDGKTILFCSHILEDVDRLVDNILVLHKGKNLFYGKLTDLCVQQKKNGFVGAFLSLVHTEKRHAEFN